MTPEALAELHRAAFTVERPWSADEFRDLLEARHTHLTCAMHGFALWRSVAGEAELLTLTVDPQHQGRGLGTRLMQRWMAQAARGADSAFLEVAQDNLAACALYARCGFATVARRPKYYARHDGAADALVMRAPLGAAPDPADAAGP
ncbi:ribosomal protein S18-alanine N-acetyltransferase [uncultured Tateyamaria sp.]|uniref:ribosomal protein S18-alanine N-acetyltransferase n=1 Tax=uncultured Tateyamaria sp. TaxID=455651 RepID=UPI0026175EC1|nr:ribosomal protein S18-alanine N-acetyltransferase [uncultured Tateyamaria sp.]